MNPVGVTLGPLLVEEVGANRAPRKCDGDSQNQNEPDQYLGTLAWRGKSILEQSRREKYQADYHCVT